MIKAMISSIIGNRKNYDILPMIKRIKHIPGYFIETPPREVWWRFKNAAYRTVPINSFSEENPCIFVLSTGRVGSKTLSSLLALCQNVVSLHEPKPLLLGISKCAYQNNMDGCAPVFDDAFLSLRSHLMRLSLNQGRGYVETGPYGTFLAPAIYRTVSNVKFIHLVRHPADVVRSGMRRAWYAGHSADVTRIVPKNSSDTAKQWPGMSQLAKNAWLWAETNHWILDFIHTIPNDRVLTIRSEDIFSGDEYTLKQLFRFCASDVAKEYQIRKVLRRKINRQETGSFPAFNRWSTDEINEFRLFVGKASSLLQYSIDT